MSPRMAGFITVLLLFVAGCADRDQSTAITKAIGRRDDEALHALRQPASETAGIRPDSGRIVARHEQPLWVNMRNTRGEYFTFRYALNKGHWAEIS